MSRHNGTVGVSDRDRVNKISRCKLSVNKTCRLYFGIPGILGKVVLETR